MLKSHLLFLERPRIDFTAPDRCTVVKTVVLFTLTIGSSAADVKAVLGANLNSKCSRFAEFANLMASITAQAP